VFLCVGWNLDISADLHVGAATGRPEVRHAGNFIREADTSCAVDTSSHYGLHKRSDIFVFDGSKLCGRQEKKYFLMYFPRIIYLISKFQNVYF
jgi:hypothetical protein